MHIPDGFIDAPTSAGAGLVAAGAVAYCVKKVSDTLDDRQIPMVGLTASFVFAAQMLNFPIAGGTSGHFFGGVLAAVLVGPYAGALAVTVVLVVQALLFADGGLTALGLNVINIALVGAFVGYGVFVALRRLLGWFSSSSPSSVVVAAGIAAGIAPVMAAMAFMVQYALGGTVSVSFGTVATAMIGVHVLIGIGEGIITAIALATVVATRPDLVYGIDTPPPTGILADGLQGVT